MKTRCQVMAVGQTSCSSHLECSLPDTECGFVDSYLQPSFGNVDCKACSSRPICLVQGGAGRCICLLRQISTQACSIPAQRVSPDTTKLCLVSLGSSLSSSSRYEADWSTLASIQCALGSQMFCYTVYDGASSLQLVVALSMLGGRRLLSVDDNDWSKAQEPCRSLMRWEGPMGPLDLYVASECRRWSEIGARAILKFGLNDSLPVDFTSYSGLTMALGKSKNFYRVASYLIHFTDWFPPLQHWARKVNETVDIPRRRLLQSGSWKQSVEAVQQYTESVVGGDITSLQPSAQWSQGPFLWPPDYSYLSTSEKHCFVAELAWNQTYWTLQDTVKYYTNQAPPRPPVARTFVDSLPKLPWTGSSSTQIPGWIGTMWQWVKGIVKLDLSTYLLGTPSQFSQDISAVMTCNFDTVQFCTGFTRSLAWGAVIMMLGLGIVSWVLKQFMVPGADPVLFLSYFPLLMIFFFRVSPFCWPMVPTCLSGELLNLAQTLLPVSIHWPSELQYWPRCVDGALPLNLDGSVNWNLRPLASPSTASCFRSCYEWPFEFKSYEDNLAWIGIVWANDWTQTLAKWVGDYITPYVTWTFLGDGSRFTSAVGQKQSYLEWDDMEWSQDICCIVTGINLIPPLMAITAVSVVLLGAITVTLLLLQFTTTLGLSLLTYTHTRP